MVIYWLPLCIGLAFGLIPPRLLLNTECRYLTFDEFWSRVVRPPMKAGRRRRWWKLPLVWIDPVRGFASGFYLSQAFAAVEHADHLEALYPLVSMMAVLVVVLFVQTRGSEKPGELLSPAGFLAGMLIAVMPLTVALAAITIGVVTAVAVHSFTAGYVGAVMMTVCIGYIFLGRSLYLGAVTLLVALPVVLSFFSRRKLVMPVRC